MNWPSISFNWNQMRAFLVTAEEGSFSAAARVLGAAQPTLGRQIAALEADLGVTLFERVGNKLTLTETGAGLLDHVRAMADAAARIALTASGQSQAVGGRVTITASDVMSAYILPDFLQVLRPAAPLIDIEIVAANDIRDLQRREADIAIRHVRPEQADLTARLVREASAHFYTAKTYLDDFGRPATAKDMAQHRFISMGRADEMLAFLQPFGFNLTRDHFRLGSENGVVAWEMARRGLGILAMADDVAAQCPDVEPVLPSMGPIIFPIWLVAHRELHTSRRIRLVFDLLAEFLAKP